ncbi:low molecular weight protein tyrosine phosphatase family protein [Methylophaga sp. OBS4]|uniref:low molecular weight protein tyrosine phosphatase family protein n=1 Tax=Methylophaga sp. OBS4 TaxID=2991935 RepID=UPI00225A726F|nr:phosphotyrosine protein phosphatase [Methylophaga sp. OBS4]MCX4186640.1 phosphotyrosine protein phosphatase [Methylophaga sp. OBS4]
MNLLFVCSENRLRSPTGEAVFSRYNGINALGCGTSIGAERPISGDLIKWADVIFVMEKSHQRRVSAQFKALLKDKKLICLDIPDIYARMDPILVRLLEAKVARHIQLK